MGADIVQYFLNQNFQDRVQPAYTIEIFNPFNSIFGINFIFPKTKDQILRIVIKHFSLQTIIENTQRNHSFLFLLQKVSYLPEVVSILSKHKTFWKSAKLDESIVVENQLLILWNISKTMSWKLSRFDIVLKAKIINRIIRLGSENIS